MQPCIYLSCVYRSPELLVRVYLFILCIVKCIYVKYINKKCISRNVCLFCVLPF